MSLHLMLLVAEKCRRWTVGDTGEENMKLDEAAWRGRLRS